MHHAISSRRNFYRSLLCVTAGFALTACHTVIEHPEYRTKLSAARTDWRGDEIVGIWVSRGRFPIEGTVLLTTQFRVDGTGYTRAENKTWGRFGTTEWTQRWWYVGHGLWKGTQQLATPNLAARTTSNFDISWRYTGRELLYENDFLTPMGRRTIRGIAVKAGDERAVEEHLRRN